VASSLLIRSSIRSRIRLMTARHLDVKTRLQGEDGCAGGDGDVAPLHGPPFSDPWSGVRSARRKFCAAATSSSGWRRRAEARARHDGPSWQVFGPQSPDPVSEQCQIGDRGNLARRTEDTEMNRLALAAATATATAPTYAAEIPVLIHQRLKDGAARNKATLTFAEKRVLVLGIGRRHAAK
jgi:hypothetical protein